MEYSRKSKMISHTSLKCTVAHRLGLGILYAFKSESFSTELKDLLHGIIRIIHSKGFTRIK